MKFPYNVCHLTNEEKDVFNKYFQDEGKYVFEGIWYRSQDSLNKNVSGYIDESTKRRRMVHYRHTFREVNNSLVMVSSYLYLSVRLPMDEYENYLKKIKEALNDKEYVLNDNYYQKDNLIVEIKEWENHPKDEKVNNYKTMDIIIKSDNLDNTEEYFKQVWDLHEKGIRKKEGRENPTYVKSLKEIEEFLPAQVELGCGPSIEAGIEPLYSLHEIYKVQNHDTGKFYFADADDLVLQVILKEENKYQEFARIIVECLKAKPTKFHEVLKKMYDKGLLVGTLFNNNFDHLVSRMGIDEQLLRVYQMDQYFPKVNFDKRAKSIISIGSHADRRKILKQARENNLKVIFVDPEGFYNDNSFSEYLIDGVKTEDFVLKIKANDFASMVENELLRENSR